MDRLGNDEAALGRHIAAGLDAEAPGDWVHEALDRLSPADQEILRLAAWEELGAEEIAIALGCGRRAAAMRLHRARRRLHTEITRLRPAPPPPNPHRHRPPAHATTGEHATTDGHAPADGHATSAGPTARRHTVRPGPAPRTTVGGHTSRIRCPVCGTDGG